MQASMVSPEGFEMNRTLVRDGVFNPAVVDRLIHKKVCRRILNLAVHLLTNILQSTAPGNRRYLMSVVENALASPPSYPPPLGPCEALHHWQDSCIPTQPERFFQVFRFMFPVYGALHVIPAVLFKRSKFMKTPAKVLLRALLGTMRSSAFLGVFVVIYQGEHCHVLSHYTCTNRILATICLKSNLHLFLRARPKGTALQPPQLLIDALISKYSFWVPGFLSGLSLFLEEPRRRGELTMYVLPKALESAWAGARGKGFVRGGGAAGEAVLAAIGMGMVMATYQVSKHAILSYGVTDDGMM